MKTSAAQDAIDTRRSPGRWLLFALLLGIALALRLWQITTLPPGFHYDEAFEAREAWHILTDPTYRPIFPIGNNTGVPPLHVYVLAGMMAVFCLLGLEIGPLVTRLTTVVLGMVGIGAMLAAASEVHALEQPWRGRASAYVWFAGASLALIRWHLHYSRMGLETLWVPTLWTVILWLLLRAWRTGSWPVFAGLGLAVGITPYSYYGGWVLPPVTAAMSGYLFLFTWWRTRGTPPASGARLSLRRSFFGLALAALIAGLVFLPLGLHFYANPELLVGRLANTADTEDASQGLWRAFVSNSVAIAGMFGPFGHPGDLRPVRNIPGEAVLNFWWAVPFYLGVLLSLLRLRRPAYVLLWIGMWGLALPGLITETAPHFTRILAMVAPTVLLVAAGLDWIWRLPALGRIPLRWTAVLLLLLGGATSARDYFVRWAAIPDLDRAFFAPSYALGRALASMPPGTQSHLTPRHRAIDSVVFPMDVAGLGEPLLFDGNVALPFSSGVNAQAEVYAVIHEDDATSPERLAHLFPTLTTLAEIHDEQGVLFATVFGRPAGSAPQVHLRNRVDTLLGDGIRLVAWELRPDHPHTGEAVRLVVHWSADAVPTNNWRILVQLVRTESGASTVVAEHTNRPGAGTLYTYRSWRPGRDILDEYLLAPVQGESLAAGDFALEISLFRSEDERFPPDGPLLLGRVTVTE